MTTWKTTTIAAVVHRAGDNPIINEGSTTVRLCDEAGGPFLQIEDCEGTTIQIDHDEFDLVVEVARKMLREFECEPSDDHLAIINPVVSQLMSDSALATSHAQIVNCLFRYIDRMTDVCDEDPADTILREFVADVMPFINYRIIKRAEYETRKA